MSVTPLGSRTGDAAGAAGAVLAYLEGRGGDRRGTNRAGPSAPDPPLLERGSDAAGYYADSVEGPGSWVGHGIGGVAMRGTVEPAQLRRLLLGEDPATGEPLRDIRERPVDLGANGPERLSLPAAASATGCSESYLRRVTRDSLLTEQDRVVDLLQGRPLRPTPSWYLPTRLGEDGRTVAAADLARWQSNRKPPTAVIGYDITFSTPKSVSILWAAGDARVQREVLAAIDSSVAAGVDYLERNAAHVRWNGTRKPADGLLGASYLHGTSRALDPQLHRHVVVANVAAGPAGSVRALDGTPLFAHAKTAGYVAAAELRWQLTERLGVEWEPVVNGLADITGIPATAIREMSTRAADIERAAAELGTSSAAARQVAAWTTRTAKDRSVDPATLRPWWHDRLTSAGLDPSTLADVFDQASTRPLQDREEQELLRALSGPAGVTELAATFDRRDVIQWLAERVEHAQPAATIESLCDRWLSSDAVIPLAASERTPRSVRAAATSLFTTPEMVTIEAGIRQRFADGLNAGAGRVDAELVAAAIARRANLGDDQVSFVRALTTSGQRAQCAVGPAGTGKTYAVQTAAWAWQQSGYRVIGAAVQGTAAEVLGRATGVESSTVASLLIRLDTAQPGHSPLDERTVLVVDEASTIGNRDLDRLLRHVDRAGATIRLIGDPAQHTAVAAGGAWRSLVDEHPDRTPRLYELRRQAGPELAAVRLALGDYREGRIADAIGRLERDERIVSADSADQLLDELVADWYVDRRLAAAGDAPASSMIAEHHSERRELNRRARALLTADGTLHGPVLDAAGTHFQSGDEVIARRVSRYLRPDGASRGSHVRNGTRGRVTAVDVEQRSITVDFEHRGEIVVPWSYLTVAIRRGVVGGLAHSYALTSHAAQGETYGAGRHLATDRSTRSAVYVGLTRGQRDVRLYTVGNRELHPDPTDDDLPRIPDVTPTLVALTKRLEAGGPERLATELDPHAGQLAELGVLPPLATLASRAQGDPLAAAALRVVEQRVSDRAVLAPRAELRDRLGPRPGGGRARQSWDAAVRAEALERAHSPDAAPTNETVELIASAERAVWAAASPSRLNVALTSTRDPERVHALQDAREQQITAALRRPAPYLLDVLGPEPNDPARRASWADQAAAIERYRHDQLGLAPLDGPLADGDARTAAVGHRPVDLTGQQRWDALALREPAAPVGTERGLVLEL